MDQERKQSVVIVIKIWNKNCKTTLYTDVIDLVLFLSKCHFVTNNEVSVTKTLKISPALALLQCTILNQKSVKINFKLKATVNNRLWNFRPIYQKKPFWTIIAVDGKESITHWHFFVQNYPLCCFNFCTKIQKSQKSRKKNAQKREWKVCTVSSSLMSINVT